jgi:PAS domain S-box-containing protein
MNYKNIKNKTTRIIFGNYEELSLERRIQILLNFITIFIIMAGFAVNFLSGMNAWSNIVNSVALLIIIYFYLLARSSKYYKRTVIPLFVSSLILIIMGWFTNAGYNGNLSMLLFVYCLAIYTIVEDKHRGIVFFTTIIVYACLILVNYFYPHLIIQYNNDQQRFVDLLVGGIIYLLFLYSIIHIIVKNFKTENRKIASINEELMNKNYELAQSHKQIKESSEKLSIAMSASKQAWFDMDILTGNVNVGPEYSELIGYSKDEYNSTIENWFDNIHQDDRKPLFDNFKTMSQSDVITTIEYRVKSKSGKWVWMQSSAKVTEYDKNGLPKRLIGIIVDISERKQAQDENEKLSERLSQAQKLESLGVLAGGIAHDFNNLLGGIYGYIDIAAERTQETKVSVYLTKALGTIDRAKGLTQQLLTFAKGGVPRKKLDLLTPCIRDTVQFALSGSRITYNFNLPEDLWMCEFDANQIGQVIDNLIINAQQAMPDGGSIEVTAQNITFTENQHQSLNGGNYVKIGIKDHGIGISQEALHKIFDPFYTTKPAGHGLGLATCYSIIKRHGGYIDVDSELGKGTTFNIYLPATIDGVAKSIKESAITHKGAGTILIMDDEEVIRESLEDVLKVLGYSVICAKTGAEAIDIFSADKKTGQNISSMIFDLTIPGGIGGKEAIIEIRKIDKNIPVFVASGYADDPVMANPTNYGFSSSISKPFRKKDIADMLNKNIQVKIPD